MRDCSFATVAKHARSMALDRLIIRASTAKRWLEWPSGFAGIEETPVFVLLKILWVYPELRGRGDGTAMMRDLVELVGKRDMTLVADENLFGFYQRFGFAPHRKSKPTGRAWIMRRQASGSV